MLSIKTKEGGNTLERNIRLRLFRIGKTQRWVLDELRRVGYANMNPPYLSAIVNGHYKTPYTEAILDKIEEIIKPLEKEQGQT